MSLIGWSIGSASFWWLNSGMFDPWTHPPTWRSAMSYPTTGGIR